MYQGLESRVTLAYSMQKCRQLARSARAAACGRPALVGHRDPGIGQLQRRFRSKVQKGYKGSLEFKTYNPAPARLPAAALRAAPGRLRGKACTWLSPVPSTGRLGSPQGLLVLYSSRGRRSLALDSTVLVLE